MVDLIGILLHDADLPNCPRQYAKEQWNHNPEMSWDLLSKVIWVQKNIGSISVSGQLPTYPSPNPTTVNWWQVRVRGGVGGQFPRYWYWSRISRRSPIYAYCLNGKSRPWAKEGWGAVFCRLPCRLFFLLRFFFFFLAKIRGGGAWDSFCRKPL